MYIPFTVTHPLALPQGKCALVGGGRELRLFALWEAQFVTGAL